MAKRRNKQKQAKKRAQQKRRAKQAKEDADAASQRLRFDVRKDLPVIKGMRPPKYTVISDRKVTLDHDKAYAYCELPIFEGEREIREGHVQTLYDKMQGGSFNERLVTLSTCRYEGVTYKINGQHTCWALVNMVPSYKLEVREIRFQVTTQDDLKAVYSMFDQNLARTEGHLTKVRLANTEVTAGVHTSLITVLISGMKLWLFEKSTERKRHHDEQMAILAREHAAVFRNVALLLQDNKDSINDVKRQPVIGAMMATFDKVPRVASQFWGPIITGLDLTQKGDARWRLRKYLAEHTTGASHRASPKKSASPEVMYRVCINCWNKWRAGEVLQMTPKTTKNRMKAK